MDKIHFILKYENHNHLIKDIGLLRQKNPLSRVLDEFRNIEPYLSMKDRPAYINDKLKDFDGKLLSELFDLVTSIDEILEYRKGNELSLKASNDKTAEPEKKQKPKRTPQQEYPGINWKDTENEMIQLCLIVYADRTNCWHGMKELHDVLDAQPERAGEMVELDIRNRQGWAELHHYEKYGDFLWKHPILSKKKREIELQILKKEKPVDFMDLYVQNSKGVTRYKSQIKNSKYRDEKELAKWERHIEKFNDENALLCELINRDVL